MNEPKDKLKEDFITMLPWQDIFYTASGGDEQNLPNAYGMCAIVQDLGSDNSSAVLEELSFDHAYYKFHISGGAAVIEASFYPDQETQYHKCWRFLSKWFQMLSQKKLDDMLHKQLIFTLSPKIFKGQINVIFQSLVYINGHRTKDGFKLIMVWDNQETDIFLANEDDIDWVKMESEIDHLFDDEEAELDKVIKVLEKEKTSLEMSELYSDEIDYLTNGKASTGPIEQTDSSDPFGSTDPDPFGSDQDENIFANETTWNDRKPEEGGF